MQRTASSGFGVCKYLRTMTNTTAFTGRLWSEAREELRAQGITDEALSVHDITPERIPKTPSQTFAWGEPRVVRASVEGNAAVVTIAREMRL
jgi:hypothetical protein